MKIIEVLEGTRCWKGYEKKGMKTMFGKRVPNCVKREHVDYCVKCGNLLFSEEVELNENLKKWFKQKWVRFGPDGKVRGQCARSSSKEGKPKCLPAAKAYAFMRGSLLSWPCVVGCRRVNEASFTGRIVFSCLSVRGTYLLS